MKIRTYVLHDAGVVFMAAILVFSTVVVLTPKTEATESPLPVILSEDFSHGVPPAGWGTDAPAHWINSYTNYAGGTSPEAEFTWNPQEVGVFRLYTGPLSTLGLTSIELKFKEYVNDYNGVYTLKVQTSINGGATWSDAYTRAGGPYGPTTTDIILGTADGVGSSTLQIAWTFSGDSFNINYWYIDDVEISSNPKPDLVIWTSSTSSIGNNQYDPPTTQIGTWISHFPGGSFSFYYKFSIEIQNDGLGSMASTIQASILPGYFGPVWCFLRYPGSGGVVTQPLPIAPTPLVLIGPVSSQMMTLQVFKLIPFPTNVVTVKIDVVTSVPPIAQDSVTVHT